MVQMYIISVQKKYTFTDSKGNFSIDVQLNDTIIVSKSIFRQILFIVDRNNLQNKKIEIALYFKAIILKGLLFIRLLLIINNLLNK